MPLTKTLNNKTNLALFMMGIFTIFILVSLASAADIAYIYKSKPAVDKNIISVFNDSGLSVELIAESKLATKNISNYRIMFVGDERFSKPANIPIGKIPTIISNYHHGTVWGLTDTDGVSKLAGSSPLMVLETNETMMTQVYTLGKDMQGVGIQYYYLDEVNKAL